MNKNVPPAETMPEAGRTRHQVEQLNSELEARILERTQELSRANDRLMKEIAEREKARTALTQGQKLEALGRLTGGIAHDFNNLLHVVNMNLELISLHAKEEKVKPAVERARSAARKGAKLTGQLLSFARGQSLSPRLTDVNKHLLGFKDLLEVSAGSGIVLELDLCDERAASVLDPGQLEMAVMNLAVNSREAMAEAGTLTISTRTHCREEGDGQLRAGNYVVVTVSDTGRGIPAQTLGKVFDPFFTTKPTGSAGLGLSQVYGFARQSGGAAFIRSEPGLGTTVEMLFPFASAEALAQSEPARAVESPSSLPASRHILVVEDDDDVRGVIVECLRMLGYTVTEAANGEQGLAAIAQSRPDLLVVDYAMPGITGAEVISRAREMIGNFPVILATGYADMALVERLAGKVAVLRKPFDILALGTAVAQALEGAPEPAAC